MKMPEIRRLKPVLGGACAVLLLAGCTVGPNYQRPAALGTNAMPAAFAGTAAATNLGAWKPAEPAAHLPRGAWWELFGDAELNRLETLATAGNQQLAAALANFEQARALVKVARADLFPQFSAAPSVNRQRTSQNMSTGISSTFNTFTVPLDASWELDLWGRVRRTVEGTRARLTAAADDLESAKLAIQAEVATDYFTLRALEAQHALLEDTIETYQRYLQLTQNRRKSGIATEYDVSLAETQLESANAQVPTVDLQHDNLHHALATLCGQPATSFVISATKSPLTAAPRIPLAVPSQLLERRPDIAAAERLMAAANADLGVATSAFYPTVMLNGFAGFQSIDASTLFNWPSRVWSVGPSLQLPLFTGGRNRAQLASARAAYDATVANYRQTVLSAFQDVEDQLAAQRLLAREFDAESSALKSARRTLEISTTRYKGGVITYLDVAIIQSTALAHEQTVVQLSASRLAAAVSLIKALGAGWSADQRPPASSPPSPGTAAAPPPQN
ncbi:MAG: efflux transporter outer membrane subunit [Verrucomicrobiota bacterium]|jgi:NodT family efflux transporter outer membrane factor (OMF) lipoprotein